MAKRVIPMIRSRIRQESEFLNKGASTLAPVLKLVNHRAEAVTVPAQK